MGESNYIQGDTQFFTLKNMIIKGRVSNRTATPVKIDMEPQNGGLVQMIFQLNNGFPTERFFDPEELVHDYWPLSNDSPRPLRNRLTRSFQVPKMGKIEACYKHGGAGNV